MGGEIGGEKKLWEVGNWPPKQVGDGRLRLLPRIPWGYEQFCVLGEA